MEGKTVKVTMMVLIMLVLSIVQAQNFPPLDPSIPPVLDPSQPVNPGLPVDPSQPINPGPPSQPVNPGLPLNPGPPPMTCSEKCATKCAKAMIPIIFNICNKGCLLKCKLIGSEYLYNCTNSCAQSMPTSLHSDKEKMESYVNSCFNKCSKGNN